MDGWTDGRTDGWNPLFKKLNVLDLVLLVLIVMV